MIVHAILFIVLPLAVAWLAGASAYFPPYPAPQPGPVEPGFEAEVRVFLAQHNELDTTADRHTVSGLRGSARRDEAATSPARLAANDRPSGAGSSRTDQGNLAA
jgi:hypothetical protein